MSASARVSATLSSRYEYGWILYTISPYEIYNSIVQAAFVGKPGSDLAAELGVTAQDDVLFAVFRFVPWCL